MQNIIIIPGNESEYDITRIEIGPDCAWIEIEAIRNSPWAVAPARYRYSRHLDGSSEWYDDPEILRAVAQYTGR